MVSVVVEKEIPAPASQVWGLLKDFGDIGWSGMTNVEVEGSGVGMLRRIVISPEFAVEERLEAYDADAMTLTYQILTDTGMPVLNVHGTPRVSAVSDETCVLSWSAEGQLREGAQESEAIEALRGFYTGLVDTVAAAVTAD